MSKEISESMKKQMIAFLEKYPIKDGHTMSVNPDDYLELSEWWGFGSITLRKGKDEKLETT